MEQLKIRKQFVGGFRVALLYVVYWLNREVRERFNDVSFNTVAKLLIGAGKVCANLHDELVQGVTASRIQCDEIWAFTYAKQKNVATAKAAPSKAGDLRIGLSPTRNRAVCGVDVAGDFQKIGENVRKPSPGAAG